MEEDVKVFKLQTIAEKFEKNKKSVRFIDSEQPLEDSEKQVDIQTEIKEEIKVTESLENHQPAEAVNQDASLKQKQFLEHLLDEFDEHESLKPLDPSESDTNSKAFITCRNYLAEKGLLPAPKNPHQRRLYVVSSPKFARSNPKPATSLSVNLRRSITQDFAQTNKIHPASTPKFFVPETVNVDKQSTVNRVYIERKPVGPLHKTTPQPKAMSFTVNESIMPGTLTRLQEKEQLQLLNDRFSAYVQRVRLLSEQSNHIDSSAFLQNAQILEEEITNLKSLYEKELDSMRKQIDDVNLEKSSFTVKFTHQQQQIGELQDRLIVETEKNRKLMDEFNGVHRKVRILEQELEARTMEANKPFAQSQQIQRDFENLSRENHSLKQRYESEQVIRQQAQDKLQQVVSKQELSEQVNTKQIDDLKNRLQMTMTTILNLEARVRELSRSDSSITEVLRQVREAAELELRKYQAESEENYNKNLMTLQTQMNRDTEIVSLVTREKQQLHIEFTDLQVKIQNFESQITTLEHEKVSLERVIVQERQNQAGQIHMLEGKVRDLQGLLVSKMHEANSVRDANVPLKAEIEALRILLEEEENRLNVPLDTSPRTLTLINSATATSYPAVLVGSGMTHTGAISSNPVPSYGVGNIGGANYTSVSRYHETTSGSAPASGYQHVTSQPEPAYQPVTSHPEPAYQPMTSLSEGVYHTSKSNDVTTESKYIYETTPSVNKVQVEGELPESSRPVGPVRAKSAPSTHSRSSSVMAANLGQGKDYFDEMFTDLKRDTLYTPTRPLSTPVDRPPSSTYNDYSTSTTSAIGDIKILEVQQDGKYIRLTNDGGKDIEIGGFIIQQNVGGHPVAVFRFPPRTKFPGESMITVWASNSGAPVPHQPPADFVWEEQMKWGTGPECTTILCKPNGQAVAWSTAAHRFTKNAFEDSPSPPSPDNRSTHDEEKEKEPVAADTLTERHIEVNGPKEPVYLRREKQHAPVLSASKHPHGSHPLTPTHPHTGQTRPLTLGNDNSTFSRQSRSQTTRPDPIPGQPYAGASGQRMGSAPLRRYMSSQQGTVRGTGAIANRSVVGETSPPASAFMKPHFRFDTGVRQVQSQHHVDYLPPMPRPPLFAQW